MDQGRIVTETLDGVGLLTLCGTEPQNAVTTAMWQELSKAVERLDADQAVRVLVLTGGGHVAFATDPDGGDPDGGDPATDDAAADGDTARQACERLAQCSKPVVARIRGDCLGAGVALALAADIRIAAEDSAFALAAERAASLGTERALVHAIGGAQARFLLLTGLRIEASEAQRIGLVHRVVPDAELSDRVADLARLLIDREASVLRDAKQALADLTGEPASGRDRPGPPPPHPR